MARPGIAIALPIAEAAPVATELREAGFTAITIQHPDELEALLDNRHDIAVAILDGETDFDQSLEYYGLLRDAGRSIPALMVVSPRTLERVTANPTASSADDEYFTRPYSAESLRWRVEAMCIRSQTVDDGSGPILQGGPVDSETWARRATVIAVFNPKGGVGKTTVATNLASVLQLRRSQNVLLIDADTVTGHVTNSLGIEAVRTVVDSWRDEEEGGPAETMADLAAAHPSGMRVVSLTSSPLHTEILEPERVADAINIARRGFDFVVIDLHPSYSPLNQAIFEKADRILGAGHAGRARHPGRGPAVGRRFGARHPRPPVADHQPRQQRRVGGGHGADRRHARHGPDPLRRHALRARRQRGPDGHRDVPPGEDHRGLRCPRGSDPRDGASTGAQKVGLGSSTARRPQPEPEPRLRRSAIGRYRPLRPPRMG